jgi:hypothetical protein
MQPPDEVAAIDIEYAPAAQLAQLVAAANGW